MTGWGTAHRVVLAVPALAFAAACSSPPPPAAPPTRAVPPDCQAFVDHFRAVGEQLVGVEVFTTGDIRLPLLRPSRDRRRADELLVFLDRPAPPSPKTGPTLLAGMQNIIREQSIDIRGLLAALTRGDRETYRRLSIRYAAGRERLQSLDDSLAAACGTHLLPLEPSSTSAFVAALSPHQPGFRRCREAVPAGDRKPGGRLGVHLKIKIDASGAVRSVDADPLSMGPKIEPGTEDFFSEIGYAPQAEPGSARAVDDVSVVDCVLRDARTVRFPPTPGGATLAIAIELDR
jgi:hypothetical protein